MKHNYLLSFLFVVFFSALPIQSKAQTININTCDGITRANSDINFELNGDPNAANITSISWDFGDASPLVIINDTLRSHKYLIENQTYTVTAIVSYSNATDLTLNQSITIEPKFISVQTTGCDGFLVDQAISFSTSPTSNLTSATWDWDDQTSDTVTNSDDIYHSYALANSYDITLTRLINETCEQTDYTSVNSFGNAPISYDQDVHLCGSSSFLLKGVAINFTTNFSAGLNLQSVVWESSDGQSVTLLGPNFDNSQIFQDDASVKLTRNFVGCSDSSFVDVNFTNSLIKFSDENDRCAERDISFEYVGTNTDISTIKWEWSDNTTFDGFSTTKYYDSRTQDSVLMIREFTDGCIDTTIQVLNIYDLPSISALRSQSADPYCSTDLDQEELVFTYKEPLDPNIIVNVDFGEEASRTYTYDDIINPNGISYKFQNSSCGNTARLNETVICTDCFVIIMFSTNRCSIEPTSGASIPSISFASPVPVKVVSPPVVDIFLDDPLTLDESGNYVTCLDSVTIENNTKFGVGGDCSASIDTLIWKFQDLTTGDFLPSVTNILGANSTDTLLNYTFPSKGKYKVTFSQANSCGADSVSKIINIKDDPNVSFEIDNYYDCIPADITFLNTSDTSLIESNWMFITNTDTIRTEKFISDTIFNDIANLYINEADYRVVLTGRDKYNCRNEADTTFTFDQLCEDLYVPNAFIPDSPDPELRTFKPVAINLISYKMEIFNLHGKLLWSNDELENGEPAKGWDGTFRDEACPQGTYIWKIEATLDDGYSENGIPWKGQDLESDKKRTVGTISLIR